MGDTEHATGPRRPVAGTGSQPSRHTWEWGAGALQASQWVSPVQGQLSLDLQATVLLDPCHEDPQGAGRTPCSLQERGSQLSCPQTAKNRPHAVTGHMGSSLHPMSTNKRLLVHGTDSENESQGARPDPRMDIMASRSLPVLPGTQPRLVPITPAPHSRSPLLLLTHPPAGMPHHLQHSPHSACQGTGPTLGSRRAAPRQDSGRQVSGHPPGGPTGAVLSSEARARRVGRWACPREPERLS